MDDHGTRRLNPYSLMSDPEDRSGYEISVRRDDVGRRGFRHTADIHLRARGGGSLGNRIGHLLDMAVGRIIKHQHLGHDV